MAESTIFRNIVLNSEEDVKHFLDAMEQSQQDEAPKETVNAKNIEDEKELGAFLDLVVSTGK